MKNLMHHHWFDIGVIFAVLVGIGLLMHSHDVSALSVLLWMSLITLFAHQFEEYRFPGWFPGMLNVVLFRSNDPMRYPLNTSSSLAVNVGVGWVSYLAAAIWGTSYLWLAIATLSISVGNCFLHLILIPLRGCRPYNPGMITSLLLFLPITVWFFVITAGSITMIDWVLGIAVGLVLNVLGVVGLIRLMANPNTKNVFLPRQVTPAMKYATAVHK